ncbi:MULTISPECIES: hypothetical protein [Methylobacteriaceae]|uniref:hypothetical protein n=1 Tax=Methylobacteriaceae TaxID=119045 RepID=UPI000CDA47C4|nr:MULTISPECIES: hypothetical protein [Methylobacteriaceae]MCP1549463.1 hypothetical protein [Methylorubrum zatmanii]MCP1553924.1 hypothetical protein [Methylorubrum extorquens]MCP1579765.1 hypothetical protein [Methylorubrum extorquens]POR40982.1 hypothetical protein CRT23_21050 [Methylobacterium sp. V23]
MPGIDEARKALLLQMRRWTADVTVPYTGANRQLNALEAEIRAIRAFVDVDRRIRQSNPVALQERFPGTGMYRTSAQAPEIPDA